MTESKMPAVPGMTNLARKSLGARVTEASDDFFAAKENLTEDSEPVFIADKYTQNGKWMDGWESRRKRSAGFDWCIVRLAVPGIPGSINIDTSHFRGNHPPYASVQACLSGEDPGPDSSLWEEILPQSPLRENSPNLFPLPGQTKADGPLFSHIKLNIYPDGGVARLRVYGHIPPDPEALAAKKDFNLLDFTLGAKALCCSDSFFSPMENLILPGMPQHMGEGWETRRRRHPGHDWVIVKAAVPGKANSVRLSTKFFKGNFPASFSLEACMRSTASMYELMNLPDLWQVMLPEQKAGPDQWHEFSAHQLSQREFSHIRLNIYPDGGVARLRIQGDALQL